MTASRLNDVTLYVPARNAAAWLSSCVAAIGRLDPAPARVLVIYDPDSRDETAAIARALPNVEAIAQSRPGLTAARNIAFTLAQTRWVASIDADVIVAPDWLGALWQARADLKDPAALSGRSEERVTQAGDAFRALMMPHHWGAHVMRGPFMTISDALFDREAVLAIGGYREALERYGDDSRLSQDLRDAGYTLAYTPHARALHVRTDSVATVLDLRWAYSEPRQRQRLADLEGLIGKLAVNVEYGRMATARALEAGEPALACIGALLPIHHALADCRALLRQRTLLSNDARDASLGELREALQACVIARAPTLASLCAAQLNDWQQMGQTRATPWPAYAGYVQRVVDAIASWCDEVSAYLDESAARELCEPSATTIARWSALLGGPDDAERPGTAWPKARSAAPWRDERPSASLSVSRSTRPPAQRTTRAIGGEEITAVALETFDRPSEALRGVVQGARAVGLSYMTPRRLQPGVELLLAVDLAEACAAAGLAISSFATLAGGVELWAERFRG